MKIKIKQKWLGGSMGRVQPDLDSVWVRVGLDWVGWDGVGGCRSG